MNTKELPIQYKITILSFAIVLFSLLICGVTILRDVQDVKVDELRKQTLITARTVSELSEVRDNIIVDQGWETINPIIERIRIINDADYIVVLNNKRIRYSHPIEKMLGTTSSSQDYGPAFARHTYTSLAKGDVGVTVRAFAPIKNKDNEQIGIVIVGKVLPSLTEILFNMKDKVRLIILLTLLFGGTGSWLLARQIKNQMYRLEPHEIVRILEERTAAFNAMNEGVIAIDSKGEITVFNKRARKLLDINGEVIGENIDNIHLGTTITKFLAEKKPVYNKEIRIRNINILTNRVPIKVKGRIVGLVVVFQDRTEVTKLAEELTGVKSFVEALRVQNHEHLNKVHTITGLIQLGNIEGALNYAFKVKEEKRELTRFLTENINDESLAGLLLSKISRGKELGIDVEIDRSSKLIDFPNGIDQHDLVIILGNLLENSFHALEKIDSSEKNVEVSIEQIDYVLEIRVEDNGCGIAEEDKEKIFEQGYSSKQKEGHGIGLYLIKQIVEKGKGFIEVDSEKEEGTVFTIIFPIHKVDDEGGGNFERSFSKSIVN